MLLINSVYSCQKVLFLLSILTCIRLYIIDFALFCACPYSRVAMKQDILTVSCVSTSVRRPFSLKGLSTGPLTTYFEFN